MTVYLDVVVLLNFLVDFLLLLGTNRLCGYPLKVGKVALAALLGGLYGGVCVLPNFRFMGNLLWRLVCLGLMGRIAFGFRRDAIFRTAIFTLLSMALGGLANGLGKGGLLPIVFGAVGIYLLCKIGFPQYIGNTPYLPVELSYGGKRLHLLALHDTGNTLKDPITGQGVLVIGADAAGELTGLTKQQLAKPVEAMTQRILPGLRLIPYQSIGQPQGMLLALRLQDVKIGEWRGSRLVAFAPDGLGSGETYQALTGGVL